MDQLELFERSDGELKMSYEDLIARIRRHPAARIAPRVKQYFAEIQALHALGVAYRDIARAAGVNEGSFLVAIARIKREQERTASHATR